MVSKKSGEYEEGTAFDITVPLKRINLVTINKGQLSIAFKDN